LDKKLEKMEKGINQEAMKPGRVFNYGTLTGFAFPGFLDSRFIS
jgi:hypothetical protein